MSKFAKLTELTPELPAAYRAKATALVTKMSEVIEGISDVPLEWKPHILKLVQATSDRSKLPKGATIGSLILGETIISNPIKIIPLRVYTTRQMWNSDPDVISMICSSPDGITGFRYGMCKKCPHQVFDEIEKRAACNKAVTVIAVMEDFSDVFYLNFTKTNYANGVDWQSLMKKAGVSPYKRIYEMTALTSPKVKNVEITKMEPVVGVNVVHEKVLPFIEELFRIAGTDRIEALTSFYEYVENKKESSQLLLINAESSDSVTLITAEESSARPASTGGYTL